MGDTTRILARTGTGVVISEDGLILTNNHVVSGADVVKLRQGLRRMEVEFIDGVGNTVTLSQELLVNHREKVTLTILLSYYRRKY